MEELCVVVARLGAWSSISYHDSALLAPEAVASGEYAEALAPFAPWAQESAWFLTLSRQDFFGNPVSLLGLPLEEIAPETPVLKETGALAIYTIFTTSGILAP